MVATWPSLTAIQYDADDLRDYIACTSYDDSIPDTGIQPIDFVLIMQGGVTDGYSANMHRFKPCDRRQCTGTPYLHIDIQQSGHLFLRRKFMRQRPAGRTRYKTEFLLLSDPINLVDNTIDLVGQTIPFRQHLTIVLKATLNSFDDSTFRVNR